MSLVIDDNGTISMYQGDSGELVVSGLDEEKVIPYILQFKIIKETLSVRNCK